MNEILNKTNIKRKQSLTFCEIPRKNYVEI